MEVEEIRKILPEPDVEYLLEKQYVFEVHQMGGDIHIIIHHFSFPNPYQPNEADILVILPAGYPNGNPDMFWTCPDVKLNGDRWPMSSDVHQDFHGKNWQRWSRHMAGGSWRTGVDNLRTYMTSVIREIGKGI
jgi:hypothetical protein